MTLRDLKHEKSANVAEDKYIFNRTCVKQFYTQKGLLDNGIEIWFEGDVDDKVSS